MEQAESVGSALTSLVQTELTSDIAAEAAPASTRRGKHARPAPADVASPPVQASPRPIDTSMSSLDGIDLSVLAGGTSDPVSQWSQKLATPGAKIGVMVAGIAIVGAVGLLLLTVAGMVIG